VCIFLKHRPVVNSWYRIKKLDLPKEIIELHKNNLSIKSSIPDYVTGKEAPPTICYEETGNVLMFLILIYKMMNYVFHFITGSAISEKIFKMIDMVEK
jgi:hypothetical protein